MVNLEIVNLLICYFVNLLICYFVILLFCRNFAAMKHYVLLAFGSNITNGSEIIEHAVAEVTEVIEVVKVIRWSGCMLTKPVGIVSPMFTNGIMSGTTDVEYDELLVLTKRCERRHGDRKSKRAKGIITLDIDILKFDDNIYHVDDWEREYVKAFVKGEKA